MPRRSASRASKIPEMTIHRLSVYTRCLLQLEEDGVKTISSQEMADRFNLNSAQVRKDLAYFGEFGAALFHYKGFGRQGFRIAAIVDDDPAKVAREVESVPVVPSRDLAREVKARGIQIAIVAVPAESAQAVTDRLVSAGIRAILNFAPARLKVPREVRLKNVDLSIELETLSFYLAQGAR